MGSPRRRRKSRRPFRSNYGRGAQRAPVAMRVVLGVSGGIAAYKTPDLVRRLRDVGAEVCVVMTPNAARFVTPLALATVSEHGVIVDQWGDPERGGVDVKSTRLNSSHPT